ncbi:MAG: glycosyltransferase family 4 protein [Luteolibacter sp.]
MLRVAILAEFPLSALEGGAVGRGGGQGCTWLPQLALAFQECKDLEVHWVVLDRTIHRPVVTEALGQWFHRVPAVKFSVDLALNYFPARFVLGREIRRIKPDLVHAWGTELIYPAALRDFKGPRILSMQGILTEYQKIGGLPDDWRWRKMISSEPAFIRSATIVTSESQWGIDKVRIIYPQADCRMVEYGVHPSFYDLRWKPDPNAPYALYVGGSGCRKGLDILIEAMKLRPDRTWELRLAGDPGIRRECEAAGLTNVTYLGMMSWPEMKAQLQGAWCGVLPTRGDTSPNSVKEARVIGVPMVTTLHGGQSGYIRDGVNGRIVEPLSAESLASCLSDVMSSHERASSLGRGRHAEDRAYLAPERTAAGFYAIYHELVTRFDEKLNTTDSNS